MKNRGLYGQTEGNESRPAGAALAERLDDNQIAEGKELAVLTRMVKERKWKEYEAYIDGLRKVGWNHARIESLISRSSFKM